jgi:hypothetical protein
MGDPNGAPESDICNLRRFLRHDLAAVGWIFSPTESHLMGPVLATVACRGTVRLGHPADDATLPWSAPRNGCT